MKKKDNVRNAVTAVPTPVSFKENADADMCRAWAWEQVKKDVTTDSWTMGDSCNFYGFYCWGWDMRRQYNEQRAPAVPDDITGIIKRFQYQCDHLSDWHHIDEHSCKVDRRDLMTVTAFLNACRAAMLAAAPTTTKAV